ncbi:MAG: tyrosine-type recombinase/integrase [Frateuria sp.]
MASIIKRGDRWQARIRRKGFPILSESFARRFDAEAWARKVEGELERGIWRDNREAESTTLRELLDRYESEKTAQKRGCVQELSVLAALKDERVAARPLASIRSQDVAALRDAWQKQGYRPATVRRRLSVLSHAFEVARKEWGMEGLINPVRLISQPTVRNGRDRRVTGAELDAICASSRSPALVALIGLAVETAMRRSELVDLRWADIDLERRVVRLQQTKNGDARDVPLTSAAVEIFRGLERREDGRVFEMRADSVTQAFDRACGKAGVDDLRFHDLRHEATSRLAEKLQLHELAKVTGHRDMRMVARYYHPRAEDLARKLG